MTESEILNIIQKAIREEADAGDLVVTTEMSASDVPGWDSLAHSRIMLSIEIAIDRRIDINATYRASTIGDLAEVIRKAVDSQG